jgi:hypothetical protein
MRSAVDAAEKVMALVDEFPSEPFSFERKSVLDKVTDIIANHTQEYEDELAEAFEVGRDTGSNEMAKERREEIKELEDEIAVLREEKDKAYQEGYDAGLDTGLATAN